MARSAGSAGGWKALRTVADSRPIYFTCLHRLEARGLTWPHLHPNRPPLHLQLPVTLPPASPRFTYNLTHNLTHILTHSPPHSPTHSHEHRLGDMPPFVFFRTRCPSISEAHAAPPQASGRDMPLRIWEGHAAPGDPHFLEGHAAPGSHSVHSAILTPIWRPVFHDVHGAPLV